MKQKAGSKTQNSIEIGRVGLGTCNLAELEKQVNLTDCRWKRYQDLYRDQKDMTDDKVLLQSLARGLESMQNISSIVYSPRQHLIPTERKDLKNLLARGSCQGRDHGSRITTWNHPFRELIGAVFLSQYTRIRELTIERTPVGIDEPSTQFSLSIFTFPDSNDVKAGRHLFRHLIRLDLNVSLEKPGARASPALGHVLGGGPGTMFGNHTGVFHNPYMQAPPGWLGPHQPPPVGGAAAIPAPVSPIGPHPVGQAVHAAGVHSFGFTYGSSSKESIRQLQNLTRCLRAAQDLRYLSLCIPHWSDSAREMYGHIFPDGRPIFHSLGLWITWPMLRSLSLEGIHADERDLIDLVKRHRDTLRVLDFSKCSLCMGTWAKVIDEVVENASMISSFTLKEVNDAVRIRNLDNDDGENWRYEGHLVVAENGEREFVRT
jgi:hypothetical protein